MQREQGKDGEAFDRVVQALAGPLSRRGATGVLVGLLATVAPLTTPLAFGRGGISGRKPRKPPCRKRGKKKTCNRPVPPRTSPTPLTCASSQCADCGRSSGSTACYNATIEPCLLAAMQREDAAQATCDAAEAACAAKCALRDFDCLELCGDTAETCNNAAKRQIDLDFCACDRQFPCCSENNCAGL
jgi:hypothetical protein